jgi:hypothetical protein
MQGPPWERMIDQQSKTYGLCNHNGACPLSPLFVRFGRFKQVKKNEQNSETHLSACAVRVKGKMDQKMVRNPSEARLVASITMLISRWALQVSFSLLAGSIQNFSIPSQSGW